LLIRGKDNLKAIIHRRELSEKADGEEKNYIDTATAGREYLKKGWMGPKD